MTTSTSPVSALRMRVSRLPRTSTISTSGRSARTCATRRSELVPTRAPCGSVSSEYPAPADERVTRIDASRSRRDVEALGQLGGDVLHGVDAQVDRLGQQLDFELLGEQTLAAHLGQRHVEDLVPRGLDDLQLNRKAGDLFHQPLDVLRLPEGELAAPGPDHQLLSARCQLNLPSRSSSPRPSRTCREASAAVRRAPWGPRRPVRTGIAQRPRRSSRPSSTRRP